ncbi:Exopolyphosphatase [gamma proteobacterium HdN1]|nr:Exopolyphosphatase [gamma proteobacterium HdN1]
MATIGGCVNPQARSDQNSGQLMAAIDMGSNSFHMVLARLEGGEVRLVRKLGEKVTLASGLNDCVSLSDEAIERGLACLRRFAQLTANVDPAWVRCVGTSTLRRAKNAESFLVQAREILNCPVEVVAGREEARLIYLGVSHSLPDTDGRRLVFDVGGGSTEFIIGERFNPLLTESRHIGCVEFRDSFFAGGKLSARAFQRAVTAARREVASVEVAARALGWSRVFGASGSVRAVEKTAIACGYVSQGVTLEAMYKLRERVLLARTFAEMEIPGLKEDRRSVFPSGLAIIIAVCEQLKIESLQTTDGALREGLLYDMLGRLATEDVRERSIRAMMGRYSVDVAQANRVQALAMVLLDRVAKPWCLESDEWRECLGWAALTHEVGLIVSHSGYHKHGAYLLTHTDLAGFTRQEQLIVASLVISHRRKMRVSYFDALPSADRPACVRVALLLRLAVVLNHSRCDANLSELQVMADADGVSLSFPEGWLSERPLTEADLQEEVQVWKQFGGVLNIFERVPS